jgi:integrase
MNDYLKELGEYVGMDQKFTIQKNQGYGLKTIEKYAFERITCHTARRTFVTLSLENGMPPEVVMKIVGHKDFKTMQKYLKILPERAANEMNKAWKSFEKITA